MKLLLLSGAHHSTGLQSLLSTPTDPRPVHISQGFDRDPRTAKISLLRPAAISSCQADDSVDSSKQNLFLKAI